MMTLFWAIMYNCISEHNLANNHIELFIRLKRDRIWGFSLNYSPLISLVEHECSYCLPEYVTTSIVFDGDCVSEGHIYIKPFTRPNFLAHNSEQFKVKVETFQRPLHLK